jgi:hypothetical protein
VCKFLNICKGVEENTTETSRIVLSAGLIFLAPTQITSDTDTITTSGFDTKGFNLTSVGADPVDAFYGAKSKGISWNYGTTENVTVQTFDVKTTQDLSNMRLRAEVSRFRMNMDCEEADIGVTNVTACPWKAVLEHCFIANISGSKCVLKNVMLGQTAPHVTFAPNGRASNFQGFFDSYVCNSNFSYVEIWGIDVYPPEATSPDDYRFMFTMSEVLWDIRHEWDYTSNGVTYSEATNWSMAHTTGVICKPSYSVDKYDVTLSPADRTIHEAVFLPNTSASLPGLELKTLIDGILRAQESATFGQGGEDAILGLRPVPSMFQILAGVNNDSRQAAFMDNALLERLSSRTMIGIGAQLAYKYLMQDDHDTILGTVVGTQQRLRVSGLTTILMLITLGLLAAAMSTLIRIRPRNLVPCATSSLASAATILAASTEFREHLKAQDSGAAINARTFSQHDYLTVVDVEGRFMIQSVPLEVATSATRMPPPLRKWWGRKRHEPQSKITRWWTPTPMKKWFVTSILVIPLMLIAALELLQHLSDRNDGIVRMKTRNDYNSAIAYIPISVMLLVAMMYTFLDSTLSMLSPYLPLRHGNAPASHSILTSLVSTPPPYTMYLAIVGRHWAVISTVSGAFLASLLTIVASGLYSPISAQAQQSIQMQQTDILNLSHVDTTVNDNFAGSTTKLNLLHELAYPWTYNGLVMPTFEAVISDSTFNHNDSSNDVAISLRTPALRPILQCTPLSPSEISHTGYY